MLVLCYRVFAVLLAGATIAYAVVYIKRRRKMRALGLAAPRWKRITAAVALLFLPLLLFLFVAAFIFAETFTADTLSWDALLRYAGKTIPPLFLIFWGLWDYRGLRFKKRRNAKDELF